MEEYVKIHPDRGMRRRRFGALGRVRLLELMPPDLADRPTRSGTPLRGSTDSAQKYPTPRAELTTVVLTGSLPRRWAS